MKITHCILALSLSSHFVPAAPVDPDANYNAIGFGLFDYMTGGIGTRDLAVSRDGKIVTLDGLNFNTQPNIHVTRLLDNGLFDNSFNGGGQITNFVGNDVQPVALRVQKDGKSVTLCTFLAGGGPGMLLARFKADGGIDNSFSGDGKFIMPLLDVNDTLLDLFPTPGGGYLVVFTSSKNGKPLACFARFSNNGQLNTALGRNGIVKASLPKDFVGTAATLQRDGKCIIVGYRAGAANSIALARFLATGAPDAGFGSGGAVITNTPAGDSVGYGITTTRRGKIAVVSGIIQGGNSVVTLVQYHSDGRLNTGFGTGGFAETPGSNGIPCRDIAEQKDGKLYIGATANLGNDSVIWRFTRKGQLDFTFSNSGSTTIDTGNIETIRALALDRQGRLVYAGRNIIGGSAFSWVGRILGGPHPADVRVGTTVAVTVGDNFFNFAGIGSTQNVTLKRGESRTLFFAVQNEGIAPQSFSCNSTAGSADFTVKYTANGADITDALAVQFNHQTPKVKPGALALIAVKVKNVNMAPGTNYSLGFIGVSNTDGSGDLCRLDFTFE